MTGAVRVLWLAQAWWLGWAVLFRAFMVWFFFLFMPVVGVLAGGLLLFPGISLTVNLAPHTALRVVAFALPVLIIPITGWAVRQTVLSSEDWEMVAKRLRANWYGLDQDY